MTEYDVAIVGSGLCGNSLALLLRNAGCSVVVVNDNPFGDELANGDISVAGKNYNLVMSYLHDVEGMVAQVVEEMGVSVGPGYAPLEHIETVVAADGSTLCRERSFDRFIQNAIGKYPDDSDKLARFFETLLGLNKETMSSMSNKIGGFLQVPLFMKYYKTSFKSFVETFSFSDALRDVLMTFAPWEDVSMIAMASYWPQISSMGRYESGFAGIHGALRDAIRAAGGDYFAYLPVEGVSLDKDGRYLVRIAGRPEEECIKAKKVAFVSGRARMAGYGIEPRGKERADTRYSSTVCFLDVGRPVRVSPVPAYLRFRTVDGAATHRVNFSYLERSIVKAEYLGPLGAGDHARIVDMMKACIGRVDGDAETRVVGYYPPTAIASVTGFDEGCVYSWAHSVPEIIANPIQQLEVRPGLYALGDWTTGYFYAAEMYSRAILKNMKGLTSRR